MKKIMTIALLSAIVIAGCSTPTQRDKTRNDLLQSWVGYHLDDIIAKWGVPATEHQNKNGTTLYEWKEKPWADHRGVIYQCVDTFLADKDDVLIKWKYSSDCFANVGGFEPIDKPIPQPTL